MKTELREIVKKSNPNPAHILVDYLHRLGKLSQLVTQNIDSMHQRAGLPMDKIIELHGSERDAYCVHCAEVFDRELLHQQVLAGEVKAPTCECGSPVKISTVSFGEGIPRAKIDKSIEVVCNCDLLIIMVRIPLLLLKTVCFLPVHP